MIAQPMSSGTRHPHVVIALAVTVPVSARPITAVNTTASCWLADCHEQKNPRRPGVAISAR